MEARTEVSPDPTESPTQNPHQYDSPDSRGSDGMPISAESTETPGPSSESDDGQTTPKAYRPLSFGSIKDAANPTSQLESRIGDDQLERRSSQELQSDTNPTSVGIRTEGDPNVGLDVEVKVDTRIGAKADKKIDTKFDTAIDLSGVGSQYDLEEVWKIDPTPFSRKDRQGTQLPVLSQKELLQAKTKTPLQHKGVKRRPVREAPKPQPPIPVPANHSASSEPEDQTETPRSNIWRDLRAQLNRIQAGLPLDFGPPVASTHARRIYDENRKKKAYAIEALERKQTRLYTLPAHKLSLDETTYWNIFSPDPDMRPFTKRKRDLSAIRPASPPSTSLVLPSIKDLDIPFPNSLHRSQPQPLRPPPIAPFPLASILKRKAAQGITGRPPNKKSNRAKMARAPPKPTHPAPLLDPASYGFRPVDGTFTFLEVELDDVANVGGKILHLGCREGATTFAILHTQGFGGTKIVGIDVSTIHVDAAEDVLQNCNLKGAKESLRFQHVPNMTRLPFPSDSFDLVFADDIMSRLPSDVVNDEAQEDYVLQILDEMMRVTKFGGNIASREPIAQHFIPSNDLDNLYTINMFKAAGMRNGFMGNRIAAIMRQAGIDLRKDTMVSTSAMN
ncbi:hypothetical protein GGR57DRAFT_286498 [Xylariaceae sp. FL1272]|nr:hypothetical protein GGR57DRAFT_286498 [Xylariaceae sp. FL1272]